MPRRLRKVRVATTLHLCKVEVSRLGINIDASAFPPQPTPQELQQFQQMCFDRAQRQRATQMKEAAQTSQFMHGLGMQVRNAMAERVCYNCGSKVAPGKCSNCGAV